MHRDEPTRPSSVGRLSPIDLSESFSCSVDGIPTRRVGDLEDGTMRRTIVVLLGCVAVLTAPASAVAGQGDTVDPALMQPGLNPAFGPWDCWRTGDGITCEGHLSDAWTNREWDHACDGRPVYSTGTEERVLVRHGDEDGLGLWSRAHVDIREVLSLQPDGSGPTLTAGGHWAQHYEYLTPGDVSTRVERNTGMNIRVSGPGVGSVLRNVGVETFDIDGNRLVAHGSLLEGDAAFGAVCDAFAELGA
ncbi:MAG: hypothetical protein ACJ777_02715 [Chloroflexota bacterium]